MQEVNKHKHKVLMIPCHNVFDLMVMSSVSIEFQVRTIYIYRCSNNKTFIEFYTYLKQWQNPYVYNQFFIYSKLIFTLQRYVNNIDDRKAIFFQTVLHNLYSFFYTFLIFKSPCDQSLKVIAVFDRYIHARGRLMIEFT